MTPRALLETTQALMGVEAAAQPPLPLTDLPMSPDLVESPYLQSDIYLPTLLHSVLSLSRLINVFNRNWRRFDRGGLGWKEGGGVP